MRASPAFQVSLRRFSLWRGASAVLAGCAAAAMGLWWHAIDHELAWFTKTLAAAAAVGFIALAASLLRQRPLSLRWDGQQWHLGPASSIGNEPGSGRLGPAVDLGGWMLLRFDHEPASRRRLPVWIGVQRRGLEREWHALRCAVYSPRPDSVGPTLHDSSSRASTRPRPAE
jgi:hypothetical protein